MTVHLVDSHYCSDPAKFISVLLTSLSTMVQVELPHISILSKVDLIQQYGKLGRLVANYTNRTSRPLATQRKTWSTAKHYISVGLQSITYL